METRTSPKDTALAANLQLRNPLRPPPETHQTTFGGVKWWFKDQTIVTEEIVMTKTAENAKAAFSLALAEEVTRALPEIIHLPQTTSAFVNVAEDDTPILFRIMTLPNPGPYPYPYPRPDIRDPGTTPDLILRLAAQAHFTAIALFRAFPYLAHVPTMEWYRSMALVTGTSDVPTVYSNKTGSHTAVIRSPERLVVFPPGLGTRGDKGRPCQRELVVRVMGAFALFALHFFEHSPPSAEVEDKASLNSMEVTGLLEGYMTNPVYHGLYKAFLQIFNLGEGLEFTGDLEAFFGAYKEAFTPFMEVEGGDSGIKQVLPHHRMEAAPKAKHMAAGVLPWATHEPRALRRVTVGPEGTPSLMAIVRP